MVGATIPSPIGLRGKIRRRANGFEPISDQPMLHGIRPESAATIGIVDPTQPGVETGTPQHHRIRGARRVLPDELLDTLLDVPIQHGSPGFDVCAAVEYNNVIIYSDPRSLEGHAVGHSGEQMSGGNVRSSRLVAVGIVIALAVAVLGTTASAQSSGNDKPKATDVGITDKEIHVAVIADVDSPLAPNLFKASVDGMNGWAKYINSKAGGGGFAGRKVVIDFYDSKLNPARPRTRKSRRARTMSPRWAPRRCS